MELYITYIYHNIHHISHIIHIIIEYIKILTKKAKNNRRLSRATEDKKGICQLSIHPKERDLRLRMKFRGLSPYVARRRPCPPKNPLRNDSI